MNIIATKKRIGQQVVDLVFAPLRLVLLPDHANERLGLTSLEQERINAVLPYIQGRLLDVGCGNNRLVRIYGDGVGVDVHDWGGGAIVVKDARDLPFANESFDTVCFIACLNHIVTREAAVREAARVLRPGGKAIVTMIDPVLGEIGHKLWWYSEEKHRETEEGEVGGLWNRDVIEMFRRNGFQLQLHRRFVYWMNNLFVFTK